MGEAHQSYNGIVNGKGSGEEGSSDENDEESRHKV